MVADDPTPYDEFEPGATLSSPDRVPESIVPVGFLDDLKRQAEAAKAQHSTDDRLLARNAALADAAAKTVNDYFMVLAQQLNVLRPRSKVAYRLDRRHVYTDLQLCDFRDDARRKRLRGEDAYDHVVLRWRLASGTPLALTKNFLPDIEQLEARLRQGGIRVDADAVRRPDSAKLQEMRYEFVADFHATALVTPDHDHGRLRFELANLDGLETVSVEFPAFEVGQTRLDELARWILGEPNGFLKDGQNLRRVEP